MNENILMENPLALLDEIMDVSDEQAKLQTEELKSVLNTIINSEDFFRFIEEFYESNPEEFNRELEIYKKNYNLAKDETFGKEKNELIQFFLGKMLVSFEEILSVGGIFKKVGVKVCKVNEKAILPKYQTIGDAGADIYTVEHTVIEPGETKIIPTGLKVAIPGGYQIEIVPRSGLSLKSKLRIANTPGTIDSGYRNEVGVIVENTGTEPITITESSRIAQMKLTPIIKIDWKEIPEEEYNELKTNRGSGFGSSGK